MVKKLVYVTVAEGITCFNQQQQSVIGHHCGKLILIFHTKNISSNIRLSFYM